MSENTVKTIVPVSTEHKRDWTGKLNRSIDSVFDTGIPCQDGTRSGKVQVVLSTQHDKAGDYFSTVTRQETYADSVIINIMADMVTAVYRSTIGARYNVKNLDKAHADALAAFTTAPTTGKAKADAFRDLIRPV